MSNDESFLTAIRAHAADNELRLVYSDWLEEHGEPARAAYLRLQVELVREWWYDKPCHELYARLADLSADLDPAWLAQVRRCTTPAPPVDIEAALPELRGMAKTAVRLHPRPGQAAVGASKIGGVFLWPQNEPWPVCATHGNIPYVTALQLCRNDVPELGFPPDTDLFQLLWCPVQHEEEDMYCPKPVVFWRQQSSVKHPRISMPDRPEVEYGYFPRPCLVYPEQITEYPDSFEIDPVGYGPESEARHTELQRTQGTLHKLASPRSLYHPSDLSGLYQACLSTAEGTKVGGYPTWVQGPEYPPCSCGAAMDHLLSFGSWEWCGNTWGRWVPIEDRPILAADFHKREAVQSAHGCMFGDAGQMYVFVCRNHPIPLIRASMQCG